MRVSLIFYVILIVISTCHAAIQIRRPVSKSSPPSESTTTTTTSTAMAMYTGIAKRIGKALLQHKYTIAIGAVSLWLMRNLHDELMRMRLPLFVSNYIQRDLL